MFLGTVVIYCENDKLVQVLTNYEVTAQKVYFNRSETKHLDKQTTTFEAI